VNVFGYSISISRLRTGTALAVPVRHSGIWGPVTVREPYTGAWQHNKELKTEEALANPTIFSCTSLIASDIGKCRLRLVEQLDAGIWTETSSPAFSPVLRKPNRYQIVHKFVEQWILSKLVHGNAYVLKQRDNRGVVIALYVLDPTRITPLVAPDGSVYYRLERDDLAGVQPTTEPVIVPAREIIHDVMVPLWHPLIGVSPIYACALAALQGLKIQDQSARFFANSSVPSGVVTVPGEIDPATAERNKADWEANFSGVNAGRVAILADGMKYEPITINPVDAQLVEQLKWSTETICSCYHVPAALIDSSHQPPYGNSEMLVQQYYSQCLQTLMTTFETSLDEGLELPTPYGTEFDIDDLIWLDTAARTKAAADSIGAGALSPDEARRKYFGLGPVDGGETPYMQQQNFSLSALAKRDRDDPFAKPTPAPAAVPATSIEEDEAIELSAEYAVALTTKALELAEGYRRDVT
jgi:HK97 family phage portal protein